MTRPKISLIGGGQVGGNIALLSAQKELGDIVIVDIYGKQYKVAKGDKVLVNSKIDVAEGKTIKFDSVKAISDKDNSIFEAKDLAKYNVSAKVLEHSRDAKVTIIKKKRRKGYQRKRGHRQDLTLLQIQSISAAKTKKPAAKKPAAKKTESKK